MKQKDIVIGTSALLLTFRCNLRCKLCCTTTPQMPPELQRDFPLERLEQVLERYFSVVKYIRKLSFGGGEPTLHKQLPELIDYTMRFRDQFEVLEVITNGAAVPGAPVLDMAERHKDKVFFMIDHYGAVSRHAEEVSGLLTRRGIRNKVRCYHGPDAHAGGWVDLGDFSHKHTQEEARTLLQGCCISGKVKDHTAVQGEQAWGGEAFFIPYAANTNGLIHRCARAYSTLQAGAISLEDCFVDLMAEGKGVEDLRAELCAMFSAGTYRACEFCNGFDDTSERFEPAEQMPSGAAR